MDKLIMFVFKDGKKERYLSEGYHPSSYWNTYFDFSIDDVSEDIIIMKKKQKRSLFDFDEESEEKRVPMSNVREIIVEYAEPYFNSYRIKGRETYNKSQYKNEIGVLRTTFKKSNERWISDKMGGLESITSPSLADSYKREEQLVSSKLYQCISGAIGIGFLGLVGSAIGIAALSEYKPLVGLPKHDTTIIDLIAIGGVTIGAGYLGWWLGDYAWRSQKK